MSENEIPRYIKCLYMYFLTDRNINAWLEEFYNCSVGLEFVDKYAIDNSKFQQDFAAIVLKNALFRYSG